EGVEKPGTVERPETPMAIHDEDDEPVASVERPHAPSPTPNREPVAVAPAPSVHTDMPRTSYPCDLHHFGPQPRLIVRDCAQNGVVLAFEPRWLEHEGFGASMPMRCAFSGVSTRADLIARPMVFV